MSFFDDIAPISAVSDEDLAWALNLASSTASIPTSTAEVRVSWRPQTTEITDVLDGRVKAPEAGIVRTTGGTGLFYPNAVNGVAGESGSGKTYLVCGVISRYLAENETGTVAIVDFESSAQVVISRLLQLGVSREDIESRVDYIRPEMAPLSSPLEARAFEDFLRSSYDVVVVDGVNEALALFGYSSNETDDVTKFRYELPDPLERTGACVILIDHVAKSKDAHGSSAIGSQAKKATLTGASYIVKVRAPLGIGRHGELEMWLAKDRNGEIMGAAGEMDRNGLALAAVASFDSIEVDTPWRSETTITFRDHDWDAEREFLNSIADDEKFAILDAAGFLCAQGKDVFPATIAAYICRHTDDIKPTLKALVDAEFLFQDRVTKTVTVNEAKRASWPDPPETVDLPRIQENDFNAFFTTH